MHAEDNQLGTTCTPLPLLHRRQSALSTFHCPEVILVQPHPPESTVHRDEWRASPRLCTHVVWERSGEGEGPEEGPPEGEGAASTGSRPRSMRHWRATERPVRDQDRPLLLSCGTTSVRMGIGGLHPDISTS